MKDNRGIELIIEQLEDYLEDSKIIFELRKNTSINEENNHLCIYTNEQGVINAAISLLQSFNYLPLEENEDVKIFQFLDIEFDNEGDFIISEIKFIKEEPIIENIEYKESLGDRLSNYLSFVIIIFILICLIWGFISIVYTIIDMF